MTLISALHSVSRSLGLALLMYTDKNLAIYVFLGEMGFFVVIYKLARVQFFMSSRNDSQSPVGAAMVSFTSHIIAKIVTDFRYDLLHSERNNKSSENTTKKEKKRKKSERQ